MASNIVKYGITPDFNQNQLVNAVLHNVTGTLSYSATLAPLTTGQIFFSDYLNGPCYIDENGQIYPMDGRWSHLFGDTVLENQLLQVGAGTSLSAINGGVIDANQFNGSGVINVVYGGTSSSGFTINNVLLGNGTNAIKATGLYYNPESGSLGIGMVDTTATINMTGTLNQKKALWRVAPRALLTNLVSNTLEYDGSGYYYTTSWGTRTLLAQTSDNLANVFTGILPISKGGTNNNGFTHGALIAASGSTLIPITGVGVGAIPEWNGTRWISSTTGYITQLPTSNDRNTIRPSNPNVVPLTLRTASVTGYALAIQQSGGIQTFAVDASGNAFFGTKLYAYDAGASARPYISLVAYPSRHSPYIKMESNSSVGGHAGWINTSAGNAINSSGGYINTAGSALGPGGYINTGANGGSIDTSAGGSGFIQLGIDFTTNRTTIIGGAAGSNKTIRLPNQNGYVPVVTGLASGWLVGYNGSGFVMVSGGGFGGGGISSLNGETGTTQTFATGYGGVSFGISSTSDIHTLNIPIASATVEAGLLSSGHWSDFNNKVTVSGSLTSGYFVRHNGTAYVLSSGLASPQPIAISFTPLANYAPTGNYARIDTRNDIFVLNFKDSATNESAIFHGILPNHYENTGLDVVLNWIAASGTSGNCVWNASFERMNTDLDSDSFASAQTATTACNATNGVPSTTVISFTDGAQIDSLSAGEPFRLKITRDGASGSDTLTNDAQLLSVSVIDPLPATEIVPFTLTFTALSNQAPSGAYARLGSRNGIYTLNFKDATTSERAVFVGVLPHYYNGGGLTVTLNWMSESDTSDDCVWLAAFERMNTDLDTDSFASSQTVTSTCNATNGILTSVDIPFTDGSQMDSLAAGEPFRLRITRNIADVADTMSGDAELVSIKIRET